MGFVAKILSIGGNKPVAKYRKRAEEITALEQKFADMSDEELYAYTKQLKERAAKLTPIESQSGAASSKKSKRGDAEEDTAFDEIKDSLNVDKKRPDYNAKRSKEEWQLEYEAFAQLREVIKRHDGRRAYDVQLMCAMALFDGNVAEAKTGEGKTLSVFFPAYLNAIYGRQTHVVSVNDYLTQRDSEECAGIMRKLGITVGRVYNQQPKQQKKTAYGCDIVYGTPSEFGFDYLRDNMITNASDRMQATHDYAIVDEADSILIDEARTPLIISGGAKNEDEVYVKFARAVKGLKRSTNDHEVDVMQRAVPPNNDFVLDEEHKQIAATDAGLEKIERRLGIDDIYARDDAANLTNHLMQALKAEYLFKRDKDYIVKDGEVKIVDEFTGRIMEGRRWSEGLHQAIEAKEGVKIQPENQTLATITLQNYFRMYNKLSGMTGTAMTEASEFVETYYMNVIPIPTNKPVARIDATDRIYRTSKAKYEAIVEEIKRRHENGQPVLVGTVSVENSEMLSRMLDDANIPHQTLNARQNAAEADIIAQAGRFGAVTIATNMAGRGTDIMLGGNVDGMAKIMLQEQFPDYGTAHALDDDAELPSDDDIKDATAKARAIHDEEYRKVIDAGGLCVIGSERHESRRIDNQLRGRSGRQGDPGYSRFYVSLDDDLMRIFGSDKQLNTISDMMLKSIGDDSIPIELKMVSNSLENAQRKVEMMNAQIRKNVLEYDDVINRQRSVIYAERNAILDGKDLDDYFRSIIRHVAENATKRFCRTDNTSDWDVAGLEEWYKAISGKSDTKFIADAASTKKGGMKVLIDAFVEKFTDVFTKKREKLGAQMFTSLESSALLKIIDTDWIAYLSEMDYLKRGIGLRSFGQRDPLVEYKTEAYNGFRNLIDTMYEEVLRTVLNVHISIRYTDETAHEQSQPRNLVYSHPLEPQGSVSRTMRKSRDNENRMSGIGAPDIITDSDAEERKLREQMGNTGLKNVVGASSKPKTYIKAEHDPFAGVGRNDKCPCGSGLKFKECHGRYR